MTTEREGGARGVKLDKQGRMELSTRTLAEVWGLTTWSPHSFVLVAPVFAPANQHMAHSDRLARVQRRKDWAP